ncbi:DUF4232 domain-containing protein [Streptomyces triticiradicis]|uniref:DUF4232 domain-containing protein n=1 Tax=Streptomyces triticiradicis TaxID=2651189 RepID=A0A7J5DN81_9ACTN|nr:DUF4232 domain-containing protein [Streptomyces triticiradicis]KAB1990211.1 DUF4232 domain-containing protein [Streptomyces triticiradicis]
MSTIRKRTVFIAVTATAVLGLAFTACGSGGSGVRTSGQEATGSPRAASSAASTHDAGGAKGTGAAGGSAGATPAGSGSSPDAASGSGAGTGSASGSTPVCATKDVSISAARKDGPPYTHIVLTARNTSGHSCRMNGFPEIQFLEGHRENVPAVAKSKPAAPVVLSAGAPAYALVKLSDGGKDEHTEPVIAFSVTVQGSSAPATVRAPGAEGVAVDSAKWATGYWTPELRNGADDF